jgi:hypothetical protein
MIDPINISVFVSSLILASIASKYIKESWIIIKWKNKKKRIRIHHLYIGYILSILGISLNHLYLIFAGLGIMVDDLIKEIRKLK